MPVSRSHLTRALHLALLLVVIHQLMTSLIMERPLPGEAPDWPFALHQSFGMVGLGVLALFWLWTLARHRAETPLARLLPWFSAARRGAVADDVVRLARSVAALRAPPLPLEALAGAVHGLGLLVATFLATSGAAWLLFLAGTPYGRTALGLHKLAGDLMWVYLIAHVSAAVVHRLLGDDVFSRMFWGKRRPARGTAPAE